MFIILLDYKDLVFRCSCGARVPAMDNSNAILLTLYNQVYSLQLTISEILVIISRTETTSIFFFSGHPLSTGATI